MCNYTTKADLKNATSIDTSDFAKKTDLANLKSDADKLDIDKLKNIPSSLNSLKNELDKLDVDKLVPVSIDLSKLSGVVKNDAIETDVYNANLDDIEDKVPNIATLAINATINAKMVKTKYLVWLS